MLAPAQAPGRVGDTQFREDWRNSVRYPPDVVGARPARGELLYLARGQILHHHGGITINHCPVGGCGGVRGARECYGGNGGARNPHHLLRTGIEFHDDPVRAFPALGDEVAAIPTPGKALRERKRN